MTVEDRLNANACWAALDQMESLAMEAREKAQQVGALKDLCPALDLIREAAELARDQADEAIREADETAVASTV